MTERAEAEAPATGSPVGESITLHLSTITLGEMAECEIASGHDFGTLLRGKISRRLTAAYIAELRRDPGSPGSPNYVPRRSWQELASLRLIDG